MFEPHFDRHVWIYRENPNGVFTPLNPAVSCRFHRGPQGHDHDHAFESLGATAKAMGIDEVLTAPRTSDLH